MQVQRGEGAEVRRLRERGGAGRPDRVVAQIEERDPGQRGPAGQRRHAAGADAIVLQIQAPQLVQRRAAGQRAHAVVVQAAVAQVEGPQVQRRLALEGADDAVAAGVVAGPQHAQAAELGRRERHEAARGRGGVDDQAQAAEEARAGICEQRREPPGVAAAGDPQRRADDEAVAPLACVGVQARGRPARAIGGDQLR